MGVKFKHHSLWLTFMLFLFLSMKTPLAFSAETAAFEEVFTEFEAKWERVGEDDPNRCQGVTSKGQCHLKAVENSKFCPAHGGNRAFQAAKAQELRNYHLSKYKARVGELGNSEGLSSLRDEIAILRMLIEERLNQCQDTHDLMMMSGPLADLIMKVEKVVTSCNRLESKLGNLLDRSKVLQLAQVIVQIIGSHIHDENLLDVISNDILTALEDI